MTGRKEEREGWSEGGVGKGGVGEGGWKDRREKKYNGMCTEFTKASNSYLFCIS